MNKFIIYTDGSSKGNPGPGGWAAVVIENNYGGQGGLVQEIGGKEEQTTNNRMEIMAAIEALKKIPDNSEVEIHTDSEYLMKGITIWIKNWQKNNWRTKNKKQVLNKDLWEKLLAEIEKRKVEWKKVIGHSGHDLNDRCDEIATKFANGKNVVLYDGLKSGYNLFH
jgi:ribonuclease HI